MSKIALSPNASGTGTLTIAAPNTNSDASITLPAITGGEFIVSNASGNVGMGTTPQYKLDVAGNFRLGNTSSVPTIRLNNTSSGSWKSELRFENSGATKFAIGVDLNSNGDNNFFWYDVAANRERARISSAGDFTLADANYYGMSAYTHKKYMQFEYPITGFGSFNDCVNFSTPGNGSGLVQMRVTQTGNVGCRGSFSGGQTLNDYAEYFEWSDGNPNNEDRIGVTVVLDGDKIRPSTDQDSGDDIVGVVSGTAGVVLGSSPFEWAGKYQKDEFGRIITEKVTWVHWSEDGTNHNYKVGEVPDGVVVPADAEYKTYDSPVVVENYNESAEYQSRDQRKEWSPIGLVGQVHVKNGQLVGTRWRKMKDVSDNVALWLIR